MWLAGVDGCPKGWIAVLLREDGTEPPRVAVFARFADVLDHDLAPAVVAVDMPIGLPERVGPEGRGPERAVRGKLGGRQSSVFSVPSRAAVYAADDLDAPDAYRASCAAALASSDPPRAVAKQCFHLFKKIREIDRLMTPALEARVYEVHPEVAFWRLKGSALDQPKKIQNRPYAPGLEERKALLTAEGLPPPLFDTVPKGAAADDLIDAAACALIARRIARGLAEPFPGDFRRDRRGLRMAIWA